MDRKILIVDDAMFMRMMLKKAIAASGDYTVYEASCGAEALDLYREQHPGLVFLDISMPEMNGIEVLRRIREIDEQASVIMCSALGQENMIREALDCGALDFIVKPFTENQIKKAVEQTLGWEDGE